MKLMAKRHSVNSGIRFELENLRDPIFKAHAAGKFTAISIAGCHVDTFLKTSKNCYFLWPMKMLDKQRKTKQHSVTGGVLDLFNLVVSPRHVNTKFHSTTTAISLFS